MSKKIFIEGTEIVPAGLSNGISLQLAAKQEKDGPEAVLTNAERQRIINKAAKYFGNFLTALGCNWKEDPNSSDTPNRVAKAYVNDLWKGRYESLSKITAFPSDGYGGLVQESNIPVSSMCSHHHLEIGGKVSIAYISSSEGRVVGLSKMNRIVEQFARRGAIQEQLTVAIHNAINKICEGNLGVAVHISATHSCVSCRGTKHQGASMQTAELTGAFLDNPETRSEFYENMKASI